MPFRPLIARTMASVLGGPEVRARASGVRFADAGHGYDRFGMHPDFVALADAVTGPLHERWFRVVAHQPEHIPATGPAILAANHSGTLPTDAMMLWTDVLRHTDPPRVARPVADYFVSTLPVVSTLFARCGVVGGSRGNARALLEAGELLMVFPEGVEGIGKPFRERYKLRAFRPGHVELAIRHRAPVIPVGIVGPEEAMPQLLRIPLPRRAAVPYVPVPATPVPLPVRYHILYGAPMRLDREHRPEDADDPGIVREVARRVEAAVADLLARGLREREGLFR